MKVYKTYHSREFLDDDYLNELSNNGWILEYFSTMSYNDGTFPEWVHPHFYYIFSRNEKI